MEPPTTDPMTVIEDVIADDWLAPDEAGRRVARALLDLAKDDWDRGILAVRDIRVRRPDHPVLLGVTELALDLEPVRVIRDLEAALERLEDRRWASSLAFHLVHMRSVGVVSLGDATLDVLETLAGLAGRAIAVHTDRRAVARGLGYLALPIEVAPPEAADAVLVPAVARFERRLWTSAAAAEVVEKAGAAGVPVIPLCHPLARLSPLGRRTFRPRPSITDVVMANDW